MFDDVLASTLTTNLACRSGERIVFLTDDAPFGSPTELAPDRPALARRFAGVAGDLGLAAEVVTYPATGQSGAEPPESVFAAIYPDGFIAFARAEALLDPLLEKRIDAAGLERLGAWLAEQSPRFDAMLVLSRYSLSHTRFRNLLTRHTRMRAATMPGVEPWMFEGVMTADWPAVARRSVAIARLLSAAEGARIESAGGRILKCSLAGRTGLADTGIIDQPGGFGNLPGGEAFIAPLEGTARGELSTGPREDPGRWWFSFADGRLTGIHGDPPFRNRLEEAISRHDDVRNVAELGVGTNEKAEHPDNILEAEKILGTVHVALGDSAGFGGAVSVPFHQDYVIWNPSLWLSMPNGSEVQVLRNGRFLIDEETPR